MEFQNSAQAGSLESCDILITVEKGKPKTGIVIKLESPSQKQFGDKIKSEILEIAQKLNTNDILINAIDNGALGYCIKARVETAIKRAFGVEI